MSYVLSYVLCPRPQPKPHRPCVVSSPPSANQKVRGLQLPAGVPPGRAVNRNVRVFRDERDAGRSIPLDSDELVT